MNKFKRPQEGQGAAVLTALFIVAIVAALVVAMLMQQRIDISRTQLIVTAPQLYFDAQGATRLAEQTLNGYANLSKHQRAKQLLPASLPLAHLGRATVSVQLQVLDGLLNVNSLINPEQGRVFLRLLATHVPSWSKAKREQLLQAILAQVAKVPGQVQRDQDKPLQRLVNQRPGGGNSASVKADVSLQSPSSGANTGFDTSRDSRAGSGKRTSFPWPAKTLLRSLPGMSAASYRRLAPYLTALPTATRININYAPAALIQALAKGVSKPQVQTLLALRKKKPFASVGEFEKFSHLGRVTIPASLIQTEPSYILVAVDVRLQDQRLLLFTIEHLQFAGSQQSSFRIERVWQSQNTL